MKPLLISLLGPAGVGKTTIGNMLVHKLEEAGVPAVWLDEYGQICRWAELNPKMLAWRKGNDFGLRTDAYGPMSLWVANELGGQARLQLENGIMAVVLETARGVGEPMVTYEDFLRPLTGHLAGVDGVGLVTLDVRVNDGGLILERAAQRQAKDDRFPAVEIAQRYLDDQGQPLLLPSENLREVSLPISRLMEAVVDNTDMARVAVEVSGVFTALEAVVGPWPNGHEGRVGQKER